MFLLTKFAQQVLSLFMTNHVPKILRLAKEQSEPVIKAVDKD